MLFQEEIINSSISIFHLIVWPLEAMGIITLTHYFVFATSNWTILDIKVYLNILKTSSLVN